MATDTQLPPACAFAISVLSDFYQDPETVPEEAVEAANQHLSTCIRCLSDSTTLELGSARRKKKSARASESRTHNQAALTHAAAGTTVVAPPPTPATSTYADQSTELSRVTDTSNTTGTSQQQDNLEATQANKSPATEPVQAEEPQNSTEIKPGNEPAQAPETRLPVSKEAANTQATTGQGEPDEEVGPIPGLISCQECRQLLPEYVEALDKGQNVAALYPDIQLHLLACETGCLTVLELFKQDAKINRKFRRKLVRNPLSVIWWEMTGFFRGGQLPLTPRALAWGTLLLVVLVASLTTYAGIRIDDARYYRPAPHTIPTPDGIGLSDGLKIYDACNPTDYKAKRDAASALQQHNPGRAETLLTSAINTVDNSGCNNAEAAIYHEDLQIRQSGRPFGTVVVSFDSGPGNANPTGGTDRHILYAAYSQELVGTYIGQHQYNTEQLKTPGAPLLYVVLANTTGAEEGALQIANAVANLQASNTTPDQYGLLAKGKTPILGVVGLSPSSLTQVVLPVLCRAGVPLIDPTATGQFIIDLITQTSLYRHCTPGFAFVRFSPDDANQSRLAAEYAYKQLKVQTVATFYDPSNPSSSGSTQAFVGRFTSFKKTKIVAQETAVASGLLDADGRPQASHADLIAGLDDALKSQPDLIYAPLLSNDVTALAQELARLPQNKQPILLIGGEFVQPAALQGLIPWARQQQVSLPRIFVATTTAARPPTGGDWQKQFYATFCSSFATPGSFCSGAAALDQGALLFGDGIKLLTNAIGPLQGGTQLPTTPQMMKAISKENFEGVGCPIALTLQHDVLITSIRVQPVILGLQQDGSIQIVQ